MNVVIWQFSLFNVAHIKWCILGVNRWRDTRVRMETTSAPWTAIRSSAVETCVSTMAHTLTKNLVKCPSVKKEGVIQIPSNSNPTCIWTLLHDYVGWWLALSWAVEVWPDVRVHLWIMLMSAKSKRLYPKTKCWLCWCAVPLLPPSNCCQAVERTR